MDDAIFSRSHLCKNNILTFDKHTFLDSAFIRKERNSSHQLHSNRAADAPGSLEGPGEVEEAGAQGGLQHDENGPQGAEPRLGGHIQRGLGRG